MATAKIALEDLRPLPSRSSLSKIVNSLLLPLKLIIPQPFIARFKFLSTNEELRVRKVMEFTNGRVLDVGCGNNVLVRTYKHEGGEGVGVDVYEWPGVDQLVDNSHSLPFEDCSFDTVSFVACINHIPERKEALKEAYRLLRPGGRVVLTNLSPGISLVWHKIAFWDEDQHTRGMVEGEVWGLRRSDMLELLKGAGFSLAVFERFSLGLNELYVGKKEPSTEPYE